MTDHELSAAIAADDQARDAERRDEWWSGEDHGSRTVEDAAAFERWRGSDNDDHWLHPSEYQED